MLGGQSDMGKWNLVEDMFLGILLKFRFSLSWDFFFFPSHALENSNEAFEALSLSNQPVPHWLQVK